MSDINFIYTTDEKTLIKNNHDRMDVRQIFM